MLTSTNIKWIASIALSGILLALALVGGEWGTTYTADASINAIPEITKIDPHAVPAGSPNRTMVISGKNFGDLEDTRVVLTEGSIDTLLIPLQILSNGTGLSVVIPAALLDVPTDYMVSVVRSSVGSIPTIPIDPEWDQKSNQLAFDVFEAKYILLPLLRR